MFVVKDLFIQVMNTSNTKCMHNQLTDQGRGSAFH